MPCAEGRVVHDADSHVVETPEWFAPYADPQIRGRISPFYVSAGKPGEAILSRPFVQRRPDPVTEPGGSRDHAAQELERARGRSSRRTGRARSTCSASRASWSSTPSSTSYLVDARARRRPRPRLRRRARPQPRDDRLLLGRPPPARRPCYVPLADFDARRARWPTRRSRMGATALLIPSRCPPGHSPSHVGLDPGVGARAGGGLPIVFHVGGGGRCSRPDYFANGLPPVPTSTAATRTSARSTTWRSRTRRCRRWRR